MPITPPWPIEVLNLLRDAVAVLQRQQKLDPREPVISAVTADLSAAIAKLEVFTRSQA